MPSLRVIPSLLLQGGRLVKGVGFSGHRDAGNPATTVRAYTAQKADEILLLAIDAYRNGTGPDLTALATVAAEASIPVTFGGQVRSLDDATACLRHGADKIFLNTTALDRPALIGEIASALGAQAVVLGIDVIGHGGTDGPRLFDHRHRTTVASRSLFDWIAEAVDLGAGELRLMAMDREGRRSGLDIALHEAVAARVSVPVILEGGAGSLGDVEAAMRAGVEAVGLGTMLVFSDNNIIQVKRHLKNAGLAVRL